MIIPVKKSGPRDVGTSGDLGPNSVRSQNNGNCNCTSAFAESQSAVFRSLRFRPEHPIRLVVAVGTVVNPWRFRRYVFNGLENLVMRYDLFIRESGAWKLVKGNMQGKRALEELRAYGLVDVLEKRPTLVPALWSQLLSPFVSGNDVEIARVARDDKGKIVTELSTAGKELLRRVLLLAVDLVETNEIRDAVGLGVLAAHLEAIAGEITQTSDASFRDAQCGDIIDTDVCEALHVIDEAFWRRTLNEAHWTDEWRLEAKAVKAARDVLEPMTA